jgi:hypothetical protein
VGDDADALLPRRVAGAGNGSIPSPACAFMAAMGRIAAALVLVAVAGAAQVAHARTQWVPRGFGCWFYETRDACERAMDEACRGGNELACHAVCVPVDPDTDEPEC